MTEKHVCIGCKLVACLTGVKTDKGLGEGEGEGDWGEGKGCLQGLPFVRKFLIG